MLPIRLKNPPIALRPIRNIQRKKRLLWRNLKHHILILRACDITIENMTRPLSWIGIVKVARDAGLDFLARDAAVVGTLGGEAILDIARGLALDGADVVIVGRDLGA
jgi:hypothetical protein